MIVILIFHVKVLLINIITYLTIEDVHQGFFFFGEILHPSGQNTASDIHTKKFYWDKCPKVAKFQGFFLLKSPNLDNSFRHVV